MRKFQKEQAQNFIQLLGEAHEEIRVNIEKKNYEPVLVTLADCQDGAIALGNLIEAAEGEGCVTIPLLEKYCELVFQIHIDISSGGYVDAIKTDKSLRKALTQIGNSVRDDIKVRKEIAFFPYKASMWDSLESVYLAAKEDPDCDAYCVPIPYFDKNADGSLGEMHYEGNEYPKNIEVTSYLTYSVEDRRPDVIYIHNPYDDYNRVTSVHPNFYSRNLKPYTDELIYIPYFVLTEIEPDDETAIEASKHFFILPAVFQADKVIVQSEKMRQVYINALTKHVGEESRPIWEQRILGLGSPKFDKVLNTKKEDIEIPQEWLNIIEKPDGSHKKIIFYNTSIGALLEHDEKMLEKMKSVFETFKENKDDVALLWRPHPLIQATIQSMRPQLWAQYHEIVEQYKAEGWGIYDDSAELDRAIALSDGYYGDSSSVVELCRKKGMPVMVQNVDQMNSGGGMIFPKALYVKEGELYFLNQDCNAIFSVRESQVHLVAMINIPSKFDQCESMVITDDEIFLIPYNESDIICVGNREENVDYYSLASEHNERKKIGRSVMYKNKIYMFPYMGGEIVCFDKESREITYIMVPENIVADSNNCTICGDICVWNKYELMIPVQGSNVLLIFDMERGNLRYKKFEEDIQIATVAIVDDIWYIVDTSGEGIYEYHYTTDVLKKCQIEIKKTFKQELGRNSVKEVYQRCFYYCGYLWLLPFACSNMLLKFDVKTKTIHTVVESEKMFYVFDYAFNNNWVYIATTEGLLIIDMDTTRWKLVKSIQIEQQSKRKYMLHKMKYDGYVTGMGVMIIILISMMLMFSM